MPLAAGTRLGSYEIAGAIGAGGMGEVYRAHDTKLGRDVAIKILPDAFVGDPDRVTRFEREARTLASLNHPNIAQIYGLEDRALVMELVEGEDLAATIARGRVPVDESLRIARQIAAALEAAHELGIVHRDLKPANVKVRPDGTVKVLDFGLAKEGSGVRSSAPGLSPSSPTVASPAITGLGVILGTAAYMSPEQARGRPVDRRADVWALGVVLYEMLSGRRAFEGREVTDVLAAILKDSVPLDGLPPETPESIRRLLRRCLEKDSAERLDSMAAARLEIADALSPTRAGSEIATPPGRSPHRLMAILVPVATAIAGAAIATAMFWRGTPPDRPSSFALTPPGGGALRVNINQPDLAISPDGRRIVYGTGDDAKPLTVRSLDAFGETTLQGLGPQARSPFFSPDGTWMGYFSASDLSLDARLMKVPIGVAAPVEIARFTGNLRGATWMANQTIVFATNQPDTGLLRVSADGGQTEVLTKPDGDAHEFDHLWPFGLPGGRFVLFTIVRRPVNASPGSFDIGALDLTTRKWRVIRTGGSFPMYIPTGHLIYATETGLVGVRFDPEGISVQSEPIALLSDLLFKPTSGAANISVSNTGTLAYVTGYARNDRTLQWVDRGGQVTRVPVVATRFLSIRLAPDNRRAAVVIDDTGALALLVIDLLRETVTRLSPPGMVAFSPVWSADSRDIFVAGVFNQTRGIFQIPAAGTGPPNLVVAAPEGRMLQPMGAVERTPAILVARTAADGTQDIVRLTPGSPPALEPVLSGPRVASAHVSPDGRWIAYLSSTGTQTDVFLSPYPDVTADRIQVSKGGARNPRWTAGGRALLFQDVESRVWSVDVGARGSATVGNPVRLPDAAQGVSYDVSADGQRLLMIRQQGADEGTTELRVVLNWFEAVKVAFAGRR